MIDLSISIWIPLIPLATFLIIGFLGHKFKPIVSGILGTFALGFIWVLSLVIAYQYFFVQGKVGETYEKIIAYNIRWLNFTDKLHIDLGVLLDPIAAMMLVVVTTVSFMVHLYSIGYMHGERGFARFF